MERAKRLYHAFAHRMLSRLYVDRGDYRNTVFIAGTGRSGTTWLEDIINFAHDHRILFEPFHNKQVPLLAHWSYRQYLRPGDGTERHLAPARKILSGRIRNAWIDQLNEKHFVSKRLVKDIRANLILRWIHEHFPEIPIVLLMRHPCAVASSKLALGWQTHLEDFLEQPELIDDFLQPHVPLLESAHDTFDRHILLWCIENSIPLRQFSSGQIHVCFYEDLCTDPEREARALIAFLRRSFDPALLATIHKPSALTRQQSAIVSGGNMLDSWRKHIDAARIDRAVELLHAFELDRIYDAGSLPKVRGQDALRIFEGTNQGELSHCVRVIELPAPARASFT